MLNTTKIKLPKQYHAFLNTLVKEGDLYKVTASEGYYFPATNDGYAENTSQTNLWNVLRYVTKVGETTPMITPKVKGQVKEKAVKPTLKAELEKAMNDLEEAKKEIEALRQALVGAVNLVTIEAVEEVKEEEQPELELEVETLRASDDMNLKELWAIGKSLGMKGCTRWAKTRIIREINEYKEA